MSNWFSSLFASLAISLPLAVHLLDERLEEQPDGNRPQWGQQQFERPYLIDANRPIDGMLRWYIENRLERAKASGADAVIIRLTTPGGDLEHSLAIARRLRDIDWAATIVWIPEEAISGGAIVSLGARFVVMKSSAMMGDAGPIMFGPGGQFVHAEEKIVSYTATAVRELAATSGRPTALAEAMVDRKLKVFQATNPNTGQVVFLTEQQTLDANLAEKYEIGPAVPEAGNDRFLTVGAQRAKELQLCDEVFASEDEMLQSVSQEKPRMTSLDWKDRLVYTLNRPWLTALLLILGVVGLYLELSAPGVSLPGLLAMFCFGVFFWSHFLGGTAGWLEVLFFIIGVTCLLIEVFVLPGFGVFGISGLGLIIVALIMATQDFLIPETPLQWEQLQKNSVSVLAAFVVLGLLITIQVMVFDTIPGFGRFQLRPEELASVSDPSIPSSPGLGLSLGDQGVSQSDLRPSGKAIFGEQLVDVLTEGDYVERGTAVHVVRIEGNIVTVRRSA
jgi:membrane-bound serine protease (ClpP class)